MSDHFQLKRTKSFLLDGGEDVRTLSDSNLAVRLARAWDANQGDDLQKLRKESERRGTRHHSTIKKTPAQLNREIAAALGTRSSSAGRHHSSKRAEVYEKGQRVSVLDDRGHEIGRGHVYSGENYPSPNARYTWVRMTRHGETVTEEWPTHRVIALSRHG